MDHYELEEDIMVLNNVTKFHKILIKSNRVRERTSFGQTYIRKYICESLSKFLSVSYLLKTTDVILIFFSSHNTTDHTC